MVHVRQELGASGEQATATWYEANGYVVLARNWRDGRSGEIDLIVGQGRICVFCEVKTRTSDRFGTGFEAVTAKKQQRLRRLATAWIAAEKEQDPTRPAWRELRFDVAVVNAEGAVEVLQAAF